MAKSTTDDLPAPEAPVARKAVSKEPVAGAPDGIERRVAQVPPPHPLRRVGDPYDFGGLFLDRVITPEEQARVNAHEQRVAEATQKANRSGHPEAGPRTKAEQDAIP